MNTDLNDISDRLQNRQSTGDQLQALGELRELIANAFELYEKYHNLGRDWTKETASGTSSK